MSLQVWIPFNGNLNNQGIGDYNLTASSTPTYADGKIGKAINFIGDYSVLYNNTTNLNYIGNFSWSLWIKHNGVTSGVPQSYVFTVGRADTGGYGYGLQIVDTDKIRFWYGNGTKVAAVNSNEWHHVACTVKNNTAICYVDGIDVGSFTPSLLPNYSDGNGLGIGAFHYSGGDIYPYTGQINDVRIYDHCLSPKEVKEISKGLILHYPLTDIYSTSLVNKYSGETAKGFFNGSSGVKMYNDEDGEYYHYSFFYTGTGGNYWAAWAYPFFSFTVGKKHYYSCKIRINSSSSMYINLRAARCGNDWATNVVSPIYDGEWHEIYTYQTINETFDRGGTTMTSNPRMEFFSGNLNVLGTQYSIVFDIKDVQVVEADEYVSFINNDYRDNIIYDTSGYNNNATVTDTTCPSWSSDCVVGSSSYRFDGNKYIKSTFTKSIPQLTCSFWIKPSSNDQDYAVIASNYNNLGMSGFWLAANCENSGLWFYDGNYCKSNYILEDDIWYHGCFVFDNGSAKIYVNGELKSSSTLRQTSLNISNLTIGNSWTGDSWKTNQYGCINDFRIYATALSDFDIQELYKTRFCIDNNGVLYCKELIEPNGLVGRNLLPRSKYSSNTKSITENSVSSYGFYQLEQTTATKVLGQVTSLNLKTNKTYTVSFTAFIKTVDNTNKQDMTIDLYPDSLPQKNYSWNNGITNVPTRYTWTFSSTDSNMSSCSLRFFCDIADSDGYKVKYPIYVTDIKLEEGSVATPWTPAPEDDGIFMPASVTTYTPSFNSNGILDAGIVEMDVEKLSISEYQIMSYEIIEN